MRLYKSFEEIEKPEASVLTVGTFDGVHLGHRKIINKLHSIADKENLKAILVTIYPHPKIVLRKEHKIPLRLITTMTERIEIFEKIGIRNLLILPFTKEFAKTSPEKFVSDYLVGSAGMKKILIGHDHMFGKNREGNEDLLRILSKKYNFSVEKVDAYFAGDLLISSSKIRKALNEGNVKLAGEMLGYSFFMKGKVVAGDGRGKKFGIPTANIKALEDYKIMPATGVYFVSSIINDKSYFGMANIGCRPTFTDDTEPVLEVNYFNLDEDLYAKELKVEFHDYIREEKKFSSVEELLNRINQDRQECLRLKKEFFG